MRYEDAALSAATVASVKWKNFTPESGNRVYTAGADAHVPETEISAVVGTQFFSPHGAQA